MPVKLISADGVSCPVAWKTLSQLRMVKDKLEDLGFEEHEDVDFPVDTNSVILKMVIEWADHHKDDPVLTPDEEEKKKASDKLSTWDEKFLKPVDPGTLFEVILAAKHLDIKGLLDITCKCCQTWIQGKTPEQLRKKFGITNDFTKDEEKLIRMENEWCQESK